MADIPLSRLAGGGGAMKVVGRQIETIPASTPAGTLLTAAAVGDKQLLRIRVLGATSTTAESGMTVSIDGFDYVNNGGLGRLGSNPDQNNLLVTPNPTSNLASQNVPSLYNEIVCKTFTITKVSGNTAQIITCAYDILEPLE